ncbi:helix-turn-helix domain-containing protein [Haloarculaceae archaeon H-GB2-1]|nr:helix-turn-helix domain-containing protein [Haloarculaceae archaeon H-GB1-1]MEA5386861.1 helix-turn-helix domain-containing protein [Haloarculaceae archaeon H-GB11]MEA5408336.1 helix-turn-helix domain-containing protein [Haloarculaceae archaeon H-GB2-1]
MIPAKLRVHFEGDWVDQIGVYDVFGTGIGSTFQGSSVVTITALDSDAADHSDVLETIEHNRFVEDVQVLETVTDRDRVLSTVSIRSLYPSYTPRQMILMEGLLPVGNAEYRDGFQFNEILADDRETLSQALSALEFDSIDVVRISSSFETTPKFSPVERQRLVDSLTVPELEMLVTALETGYYERSRDVSISDIESEIDVARSTASRRLRNAERKLIPALTDFLQTFYGP